MIIRGILFDLDGTLIQSMEDHFAAWHHAYSQLGITISEDEYYPLEGMNVYRIAEQFCRSKGCPESDVSSIIAEKEKYFLSHTKFRLYPGVEEVLKAVTGMKIGIVTGGLRPRIDVSVPAEFLSKFQVIVTGESTKRGKPFPDPYLQGANGLSLQPEECVVVENAPLGISAAKAAKMYVIGVSSTVSANVLSESDEVVSKISDILKSQILGLH